ncbi:hypothetical protein NQ314_019264 [Rhamnusium bicolor]|uniref:RRM domain-containing protein n=1 Tax=Rhamnusium bicolor TaxID=1586634 RepID=A0AAV8WP12_9CUCU|nr:hypothetical protein NQ314_019264 [Rhamnusium bicolor]
MSEEDESMEIIDLNDSSSSNDEDDQELINKAEELEKQISSNKYLYDAHVEIVDVYRKLGDLNSMREAYQRFHECFPLTAKLWLKWLRDEIKIANNTFEEQKRILSLFNKAVEDYLFNVIYITAMSITLGGQVINVVPKMTILSKRDIFIPKMKSIAFSALELWSEYAQYSIGVGDIQTTRSILERAVTAGGLHTNDGDLLWDTLRELEHARISLTEEGSEEWKAQVSRLADVFKRQLSVPILGMEGTYCEWEQWFKSLPDGVVDPKPIEWGYKKALKTLDYYRPFEEKLLLAGTNEELFETYKEYIEFVKDPSAVLCLYERAAVSLCLVPNFWVDYCTLSISPAPGLDLWVTYLEYVHRNLNDVEKLDKLFSQAIQQFGFENDPSCKLSSASVWLEYANLERQYGDTNKLRSLFQRAVSTHLDWPQCIVEEWLMFEREFGTLENVLNCIEKTKNIANVAVQNLQPSESNRNDRDTTEKGKKRKHNYREDKSLESRKVKNVKLRDEKREEAPPPITNKHIDKDPRKTVFVSNLHPDVGQEQLKGLFPNATLIDLVMNRRGISRGYGYIQFSTEEEVMTALARDRVPLDGRPVFISKLKPEKAERKVEFKYAQVPEANKLFVRGLPKSKTKEEIEEIFKPYGCVEVRLVIMKNGHSKGLAYVEFENEEAAKKALQATDQMQIDENVITVAVSAPPPKKSSSSKPSEPVRHARSRLQVPLIPRSLAVKGTENKDKEAAVGKIGATNTAPKSNQDFRNMLLKK